MMEKKEKGAKAAPAALTIRTEIRPEDLLIIPSLHQEIYTREYGFDHTFEAYVADPLSEFARSASPLNRIWIAELDGRMAGCIAIVAHSPLLAQLRWFLVVPSARGAGLGKRLLQEAVTFCRERRYDSIILWTVRGLDAAAHIYEAAGFRKVEEKPGKRWGVDLIEEKYELKLMDFP